MSSPSAKAITAEDIQKYTHPIPNREAILELMKAQQRALSREELASLLGLSGADETEALRRRLRAMERDGQAVFDQRDGYRPLNPEELISGRVIGHRDGFGFLVNDQGGKDLLLGFSQMRRVFDGDRVQVRISGVDARGREEASIVQILEKNTQQLVGRLCVDDGVYFLRPESGRIMNEILLDEADLQGADLGQYVVVDIIDYPTNRAKARGRIVEVLGDAMAPGMEIDVAIRDHDIPHIWPKSVLDSAQKFGDTVKESDKAHRVDLRHLPFVTIDGDDAKDFDDAVYCEKNSRGDWRLFVAIADVSHYVLPGSELDNEAQKRGTSVYFPGHVVPMLPEVLSNGLCSLNPQVDRLVMVCEMTINRAGKMTRYEFSEAVIHSHARLTYDQVSAFLSEPESDLGLKMRTQYAALAPHLNELYTLYDVLRSARTERGSIDFETQEVQFQFCEDRKIEQINPVYRNDAHKIIEECMLSANVATARFLEKMKLPALYRVHDGPKQKKLETLRAFLKDKGLTLGGGDKPQPADYDRLLSGASERADASVIQTMMLRSLSQAEYSPENQGHFGLAYSAYAHFTSPIRRYPDLLVHRAIRSVIRRSESGGKLRRAMKSITGLGRDPVQRVASSLLVDASHSYPYDQANMQVLAAQCSMLSRRADKASWDVDAWLKCEYMQDAIGEVFYGKIMTVTGFGLFIELDDLGIEGLIHITSLKDDYYQFDEAKQSLIGERNHSRYTLGDEVDVRVVRVDMDQRKIEFELADAPVQTKPKAAKKKSHRS
jgi:ribonuclease R